MRLALSLMLLVSATGCSLIHSIEPNPPNDMTGCVPSPACMLDGSANDDMSVNIDGGDGGPCEMVCPGVDMVDLSPACATDNQCTVATTPICDSVSHQCRGCMQSSECVARGGSNQLCNVSSGACVQCLGPMDCLSNAKACDTAAGMCVPCTANAQCASGLCNTGTGACADPSTLVYVSASTCPSTGQGTLTSPFCKIKDGLDKGVTLSKTVIVFGGTYSENITVAPGVGSVYTVSAVGVGAPVIASPSPGPALTLALGGGTSINITLDSFTIKGATGASGHGIQCGGSAGNNGATKLKIVRSTVSNNAQNALNASNCDVTLDQDVIGPMNTAGGILLQSTDFTLQNLLVVGNGTAGSSGSAFGGISATGTSARANVINNTVVNNNMKTGALAASGVGCVSGGAFFNNVAVGNSGGAAEVDTANCSPTYSSYVGAIATGTNHNQDLTTCGANATAIEGVIFYSSATGDYHPKMGGTAPCTLVGLGTSAGTPTYDLDGKTRPSPPAIGALEGK
jgi:hypothetical protein